MDTTLTQNTNNARTRTIADLLPELRNLLAQDALARTAMKRPRNTMAPPQTTGKFKPLTIAEMRADIEAVSRSAKQAPNTQQSTASIMKKKWNSSVKVDKKMVSHTGEGQMKHNPVRKMLNFQSRPRLKYANSRMTMNTESPKFPKPESRPKKSLYYRAKDPVRISGVYRMPETPLETPEEHLEKPARNRLTVANKENMSNARNVPKIPTNTGVSRRIMASPKVVNTRKSLAPKAPIPPIIVHTPMLNDSCTSSCDASFLQREKEINDDEMKNVSKTTLGNIAEDVASPHVSTPYKAYRNIQEYFNDSSDMDNTIHDNTIMCFEKPSICRNNEIEKREESVIVSLCDMFNKATVTNPIHETNSKTELEILLEIRNETENNIKSQVKQLEYVNKLIQKKKSASTSAICFQDKTLVEESLKTIIANSNSPPKSPILWERSSVIKSARSPSYKIPKKNCLRKKVFHKSMPEMSNAIQTPLKTNSSDKALTMYMQMKEHMKFLNTPVAKKRPSAVVPDTPAITSHNLQMQLDKLFNHS